MGVENAPLGNLESAAPAPNFVLPKPTCHVHGSRFTVLGSWLAALLAFGAREAAAQITVTLTPSNHNGYNITCFGKKNRAIDATVTGGTAPYSYSWSNGSNVEDIANLAVGYYKLVVTDSLNEVAEAEITLTEPTALRLGAAPFTYPNGLNLSCHECYNGSIDVTVTDGVAPYTYAWDDNATTADRSGLGALTYTLIVTDANGCQVNSQRITLTQPERTIGAWTATPAPTRTSTTSVRATQRTSSSRATSRSGCGCWAMAR